jgi:hypothetical protein
VGPSQKSWHAAPSVACRTDNIAPLSDIAAMPRYSFSIENGKPGTDLTEDLADFEAALERASMMAREFAGSTIATVKSRIVVRDESGTQIGDVLLSKVR